MTLQGSFDQLLPYYVQLKQDIDVHNTARNNFQEANQRSFEVGQNLDHLNLFLHFTRVFERTINVRDLTPGEEAYLVERYDIFSHDFPILRREDPLSNLELIRNILLHGPEMRQLLQSDLEIFQIQVTRFSRQIDETQIRVAVSLSRYIRVFTNFVYAHMIILDQLSAAYNPPRAN